MHAVPRFRFSRLGLNDVSVSVVNIVLDGVDGVHALRFAASNSSLPVAQGLGNTPLPTGCSISSPLEFNTYSGWTVNNFTGFSLTRNNSASYLKVASNTIILCTTNLFLL